jgi:hypothetical protein
MEPGKVLETEPWKVCEKEPGKARDKEPWKVCEMKPGNVLDQEPETVRELEPGKVCGQEPTKVRGQRKTRTSSLFDIKEWKKHEAAVHKWQRTNNSS